MLAFTAEKRAICESAATTTLAISKRWPFEDDMWLLQISSANKRQYGLHSAYVEMRSAQSLHKDLVSSDHESSGRLLYFLLSVASVANGSIDRHKYL